MYRAKPLIKIVLRMVVFGAVLGLSLGSLLILALDSTLPLPRAFYHRVIITELFVDGVILGGLIGVAMALYAAVAHRRIHKPLHFRFAMLIVSTIVTLAVVQKPFHIMIMTSSELGVEGFAWALQYADSVLLTLYFGTIAKHVAIGLMSLFVAGRYLREASAQFMNSPGQVGA